MTRSSWQCVTWGAAMKKERNELIEAYRTAFADCCAGRGEKALQQAYEIGRRGMENGMGLLEMLALHQEVLESQMKLVSSEERAKWLEMSAQFLKECLSPFELVQRGFQEAIVNLKQKTMELAATNSRLEEEIRERKRVEKEVLEISQKEQRRFGQELHDGVCQNLVAILMKLQALGKDFNKGTLNLTSLQMVASLLDQTIKETRDMAHGFYPVELEANSLMLSLNQLAENIEKAFSVSCKFLCPYPILIQDNNVATHLYRIAQEAISNAIKHGQAKQIEISLKIESDRFILSVVDDGKGLSEEVQPGGIGLMIMRYRTRMIEGEFTIKPNQFKGTWLSCSVPIAESKAPRKGDPLGLNLDSPATSAAS